ncbi:antigen B membrane protein, putative [Ixodes scapularis]|uniref:Antigen B membrane protein, putative n=1 Tax=Ixodes scapularis TaxID=6945 RepID=B7PQI8_IXOSC|nr:antigen B membrane protein, putative [Ixodes scapularis]|eukprot:XP_002436030.1 antigen B membrane protein, putative [Ixodes scapularis]
MTENMIYVTSLILERPLLETDYDKKKNFDLKDHQLSFGVVTLDQCLKICSSADYPDCKAVAYCGASCYTSSLSSGGVDAGIVKSTDCTTYIKNDLSKKRNLPLTRDALKKVETAVKESKFTITVTDSTTFLVATLVAESTDDSLGSLSMTFRGDDRFGTPHSHRRDGEELDGFKTYSLKSRLMADVDGAVDLGSYPLNDCADICRDRPDCQFFSSCLVDSQCVISTIPARTSKWMETKLQCSTFAKSVKDNFELFSGISLDVGARKAVMTINDEECARLCMVETGFDCKSFDYCGQAKDMHTVCRLHDTHLREFGEPSKMNKKSLESCMHYSKKYLYDFKKSASNKTKASARTVIGQVTPEECAKQCRDATFLCENFDHCTGPQNLGRGDCMLYEKADGAGPFQTIFSPICSAYSYRGDADLRSFSNQAALHSNATAGGLAFFLLLLGVGIGASALLAYGYYKNRRLNRV